MRLFGDRQTKKRAKIIVLVLLFGVLGIFGIQIYGFMVSKPFEGDLDIPAVPPDLLDSDEFKDDGETLKNEDILMEDEHGDPIRIEDVGRKEDFRTILICGTDEDKIRTDTIVMASFDMKNNKLALLHIPRDTLVNVSRGVKKINGAYFGGIEQTKSELKDLLGFEPDRYVVVDFDGFVEIVDALGGVEYDVQRDMRYSDPTQNLYINLKKGPQTLDGEKALWVMRYRSGYANADIGRIAVQQDLLKAIAKKLLTPATITKITTLVDVAQRNVKTDLTGGEMVWLAYKALSLNEDGISMHMVPGGDSTIKGQSYWIANEKDLISLLNEHFNPYTAAIANLNHIDVKAFRASGSAAQKPANSGTADPNTGTPIEDQMPVGDGDGVPPPVVEFPTEGEDDGYGDPEH